MPNHFLNNLAMKNMSRAYTKVTANVLGIHFDTLDIEITFNYLDT